MSKTRTLRTDFFLSTLSAALLVFCFPPLNFGFLAWFSIIPFLYAVEKSKRKRDAATCGFILGLTFIGLSVSWLNYVHPFAWIAVSLLEGLFFALLGLAIYWGKSINTPGLRALWTALAWTGVEVLRSELPIFGFGWNLLAYSQTYHLFILQFANLFGAFGLSFVIALANAVLFDSSTKWRWQLSKGKWKYFLHRLIPVSQLQPTLKGVSHFALGVAVLLVYGISQIGFYYETGKEVNISVIQGNIPQHIKWSSVARSKIINLYAYLTREAAKESPDLIVWPEAAYPGYFNREHEGRLLEDLSTELDVPFLIGSPHMESNQEAFNSALLVTPNQRAVSRYDKQKLVPFGEYVPLKLIFGWLEPIAYSMGVSDFLAGDEPVVFDLKKSSLRFSTLICFEDTFLKLSREFVENGAELLFVLTNDAWFGPSAAAEQHLQASVFRAVENGVPLIRAANTGISAFISRTGKVTSRVQDKHGREIFVTGHKTVKMHIDPKVTLFRKGGWIFSQVVFFGFLGGLFFLIRRKEKTLLKKGEGRLKKIWKKIKKKGKSLVKTLRRKGRKT